MTPLAPLLTKSLDYLESLPNLEAIVRGESSLSDEVLADGYLTITNSHGTVNYVCEIETGLSDNVVEDVVESLTNLREKLEHGQRPLLITQGLNELAIARLVEENVEFIDLDGKIYLNSPVIDLWVRHRRVHQSTELTVEVLQVIYTLLKQPELLLEDGHQQMADIPGVSKKTVKSTLDRLQKLKFIKSRNGGYEIIDYVKLLERWELGYLETLRAWLTIGAFKPVGGRDSSEVEAQIVELPPRYGYAIGRELAASMITRNLCPRGVTLHLGEKGKARELAVKLKLKPDPEGNIVLLQHIGYQRNDSSILAHPLLIHAELVQKSGRYLRETARLIYERYLKAEIHSKRVVLLK